MSKRADWRVAVGTGRALISVTHGSEGMRLSPVIALGHVAGSESITLALRRADRPAADQFVAEPLVASADIPVQGEGDKKHGYSASRDSHASRIVRRKGHLGSQIVPDAELLNG